MQCIAPLTTSRELSEINTEKFLKVKKFFVHYSNVRKYNLQVTRYLLAFYSMSQAFTNFTSICCIYEVDFVESQ